MEHRRAETTALECANRIAADSRATFAPVSQIPMKPSIFDRQSLKLRSKSLERCLRVCPGNIANCLTLISDFRPKKFHGPSIGSYIAKGNLQRSRKSRKLFALT